MTPQEFRRQTLRTFYGLLERKKLQEQRITERFGVLAATIANSVSTSRTFQPWDFYDLPEPEATELTPAQMLQWAKSFAAHFNGKKPAS